MQVLSALCTLPQAPALPSETGCSLFGSVWEGISNSPLRLHFLVNHDCNSPQVHALCPTSPLSPSPSPPLSPVCRLDTSDQA